MHSKIKVKKNVILSVPIIETCKFEYTGKKKKCLNQIKFIDPDKMQ